VIRRFAKQKTDARVGGIGFFTSSISFPNTGDAAVSNRTLAAISRVPDLGI
jgi:hypothetical protein